MAYLPVELPTGDYYGGHRPGNGCSAKHRRGRSEDGVRKCITSWCITACGIWIFVRADAGGYYGGWQAGEALAQPTKQSILYVFNRVTGEPIWPIVETPAPKGDVPGEWYSPTQPMPVKPAPYGRNGFSVDDLIDFTPELKAQG